LPSRSHPQQEELAFLTSGVRPVTIIALSIVTK
jgi:hypothetical protein